MLPDIQQLAIGVSIVALGIAFGTVLRHYLNKLYTAELARIKLEEGQDNNQDNS